MGKFTLDDSPIRSIGWLPSEYMPEEFSMIEVGNDGVTHIDVVEQRFGEDAICWFQIWRNEHLLARYNAKNIDSIEYFGDE